MKPASVEAITRALDEAGVPVRIVRLDCLLRLKRAAGRPQDLADIAELRMLHGEGPNG